MYFDFILCTKHFLFTSLDAAYHRGLRTNNTDIRTQYGLIHAISHRSSGYFHLEQSVVANVSLKTTPMFVNVRSLRTTRHR